MEARRAQCVGGGRRDFHSTRMTCLVSWKILASATLSPCRDPRNHRVAARFCVAKRRSCSSYFPMRHALDRVDGLFWRHKELPTEITRSVDQVGPTVEIRIKSELLVASDDKPSDGWWTATGSEQCTVFYPTRTYFRTSASGAPIFGCRRSSTALVPVPPTARHGSRS